MKKLFAASTLAVTSLYGYNCLQQPEHPIYPTVVLPVVRYLFADAEQAHDMSFDFIENLKLFQNPSQNRMKDKELDMLKTSVWGLEFSNPVGLAAGFDKNARIVAQLWNMGFGFVEIGSVLPQPQDGNAKPRIFRLEKDAAIINRCGFNSWGLEKVEENLKKHETFHRNSKQILGVNIGKNKSSESEEATISDYTKVMEQLHDFSNYIVINISSPNTPNLRLLQEKEKLNKLLSKVQEFRLEKKHTAPLLVKIAPDLSKQQLQDIADLVLRYKVDGVIVSNTTIQRPNTLQSTSELVNQTGGLSGKPVFEISNEILRKMYQLTDGKVPLIGVGGVSNGEEAYQKIKNGASLVQVYSSFTYYGPGIANKINKELLDCLKRDGFSHISQAVGINAKAKVE